MKSGALFLTRRDILYALGYHVVLSDAEMEDIEKRVFDKLVEAGYWDMVKEAIRAILRERR